MRKLDPLAILATVLGAALLFLVEPMVARMVLPQLGGTPAVWNACMFFFQVVLLAGYCYVLLLSRLARPGARVLVHLSLLAASVLFLPLRVVGEAPPASGSPVVWLLATLLSSVGPTFFMLSATGPLIQFWLHASGQRGSADPYPLYAWGNVGSLAALAGYPLLVEPWLPLRRQAEAWSAAYLIFIVVIATFAMRSRRGSSAERAQPAPAHDEPPTMRARLSWVFLAFVPSSAFLAVTQYMSTDVAVVPLLWVLPLAVYLLTMILAFSGNWPLRWSSVGLAVTVAGVVAAFWVFRRPYPWVLFILHPLTLFFLGMVCHGRLALRRPAPSRLAEFYLWIALGGALGGVFNTFIAPACFDSIAEYPLLLLFACLVRPAVGSDATKPPGLIAWLKDLALPLALLLTVGIIAKGATALELRNNDVLLVVQVGIPCVLLLLFLRRPIRFALGVAVLLLAAHAQTAAGGDVLFARRDFFGVHKVVLRSGPGIDAVDLHGKKVSTGVPFHFLYDGTTRHGSQAAAGPLRSEPTSYYHRTGPLGEIFDACGGAGRMNRIAAVGLGAGTLAAYGRPGRSITFYEIDPLVAAIARDDRLFTYLRDGLGSTEIRIGDGRTELARAPDGSYDVIVLDAFSSDAVPVHLMTREAVALYFRKLTPDGLLLAHVTNQHLDLEPVFHSIAADLHLRGRSKVDDATSIQDLQQGKDRSQWIALARSDAPLGAIASDPEWLSVPLRPDAPVDRRYLWTDDYSSVLRVLRNW
jgi:hypothetical protein